MAGTPSLPPIESVSDSESLQFWCYHCDKRVSIETLANLPDVICHECKNGFVESIASPPLSAPPSGSPDHVDDPAFGSQFLQMLRLIAQSDAPPPPPRDHSPEDDYLRIEINGWNNNGNDEDEDDGVEFHIGGDDNEAAEEEREEREDRQDNEDDPHIVGDEEDLRRRRRDMLRLRLRDLATRTRSGRNRILDWAEILMGLEDHAIEFQLQGLESDRYVGNSEDYVDGAEYEALLQTLAERDGGGRRGAPPAAKSVVSALPSIEITSDDNNLACAVCKDIMNVGEMAKKLPCGHQYHGDCIVPWLSARNSCPVCRFELPTDDPEYEDEKKKIVTTTGASGSGGADSVSY